MRVWPITGMKLVSPFQRGTMWACRCGMLPPGGRAKIEADVETVGVDGRAQHFLPECDRLHQVGALGPGQFGEADDGAEGDGEQMARDCRETC